MFTCLCKYNLTKLTSVTIKWHLTSDTKYRGWIECVLHNCSEYKIFALNAAHSRHSPTSEPRNPANEGRVTRQARRSPKPTFLPRRLTCNILSDSYWCLSSSKPISFYAYQNGGSGGDSAVNSSCSLYLLFITYSFCNNSFVCMCVAANLWILI